MRGRDLIAAREADGFDRAHGHASDDEALWAANIRAADARAGELTPVFADAGAILDHALASQSDWAITLLIDQSGSMRGRPIEAAAVAARWLSQALAERGVAISILGYTTVSWRGGHVRRHWRAAGGPPYSGRLCPTLHIVYQAFGDPMADDDWRAMLHPDALRENVDGEALEWAATACSPSPHRIAP